MLGDEFDCRGRGDGRILLPVVISPLGADGQTIYSYRRVYLHGGWAVVHWRWHGDRLEWEMSEVVNGDPGAGYTGHGRAYGRVPG